MASVAMSSGYWLRPSSLLVVLMGSSMLVNTVWALTNPAGFAVNMGLPLTDPASHGFVHVYALRALFLGLCAFALLVRGEIRALAVFAFVAIAMPVGDAILTASNGAPIHIVARHGAIAIVLAVASALLCSRASKEADV